MSVMTMTIWSGNPHGNREIINFRYDSYLSYKTIWGRDVSQSYWIYFEVSFSLFRPERQPTEIISNQFLFCTTVSNKTKEKWNREESGGFREEKNYDCQGRVTKGRRDKWSIQNREMCPAGSKNAGATRNCSLLYEQEADAVNSGNALNRLNCKLMFSLCK